MHGSYRSYFFLIIFNFLLIIANRSSSNFISDSLASGIVFFRSVNSAISNFQEGISHRIKVLGKASEAIKEEKNLKRKFLRLRMENLRLREELEHFKIFEKFPPLRFKMIVAKTVFLTPENSRLKFYIDRGKRDGVREYLPVIDMEGNLIGKTVEPITYSSSAVEPITNPYSSIGAEIKEGAGVLRGTGEKLLFLDYIYITQYPKKGEEVLTSGLDGIFPEGVKIGKIGRVRRGKYIFLKIEVNPYFNFRNLKYVGIILRW